MSSSILEQLRHEQEQIVYLEKAIVKALYLKAQNPKNTVVADYMIKHFLERIEGCSIQALLLYEDKDHTKRTFVQFLEGHRDDELSTGNPALDVWTNFYERLAHIKDYHQAYTPYGQPAELHDENWHFLHALDDRSRIPKFSGPEGYGRYVDLTANFQEFLNLKRLQRFQPALLKEIDYVTYLATFDCFHLITLQNKDKAFEQYVDGLLGYLKSYFTRSQPLFDLGTLEAQHSKDFRVRWDERSIKGWDALPKPEHLQSHPLYCLPCNKLFTNRKTFETHKQGKKHKKAVDNIAQALDRAPEEFAEYRELAYKECFISRLKEALGDVIEDSMNNVRKNQTRTSEELTSQMYEMDLEEEPFLLPIEELKRRSEKKQQDESSSSSDEERPVYNPRNLPIGYDGKPIPYWLYKLQGLNAEYKCEICGNYSYWGRRAFEKHFQEWRHAYGMRCLRIPNTLHFREITRIEEARALHLKLMEDHKQDMFRAEEEEFEDTQGNVLDNKKFDDLKRQGIL